MVPRGGTWRKNGTSLSDFESMIIKQANEFLSNSRQATFTFAKVLVILEHTLDKLIRNRSYELDIYDINTYMDL